MKARKLIEGATYGPETLKVIGKAFETLGPRSPLISIRTDCNPNPRD